MLGVSGPKLVEVDGVIGWAVEKGKGEINKKIK
jgi:hypothetical protein